MLQTNQKAEKAYKIENHMFMVIIRLYTIRVNYENKSNNQFMGRLDLNLIYPKMSRKY